MGNRTIQGTITRYTTLTKTRQPENRQNGLNNIAKGKSYNHIDTIRRKMNDIYINRYINKDESIY